MKIGRLYIGWQRLTERERIDLGLVAYAPGWEALCIEWAARGCMILVRPAKPKVRRG